MSNLSPNFIEEGDRLVSIQLEEKQRLKKNLENKKKKPLYTGYDDEEFLIGGGQKKTWLSHYDEEINGPKSDVSVRFVWGSHIYCK